MNKMRATPLQQIDSKAGHVNTTIVYISLSCILVYALIYFICGEKLPVANGLGWDGLTYAAYATNFIHEITTTSDVYHVTRMFPSLLIYCVSKILGLELATPHAVFMAFYIFNSVMLWGVGYLWYKICKLKAFNTYIYFIGFISLFINYACLKLAYYAPVFVDPCVLFFGMSILYLYLKQKYVFMCILLFSVYFTWPLAVVLSLPLIIYTFSDKDILKYSPQQKINAAIGVALFVVCAGVLLYILKSHSNLVPNWTSISSSWNHAWWPHGGRKAIYFILPLSTVIACIYIYYIGLESAIFRVIKNAYRVYLPHVALYILLIALCAGASFWLSHLSVNYTGKTIFSSSEFLAVTILGGIAKPAFNQIMHATFLGPCAILWLLYMRPIITAANAESFGLLLFVIVTYFMAVNCHSRQLTFNVPFMVYLLCKVLNNLELVENKTKFLSVYMAAALIGSKIYYLINVAPLQGSILSYPFQRFFMNFGLWTGWRGYFFNLAVAAIMCLVLFMGFYRNTFGNSYQKMEI